MSAPLLVWGAGAIGGTIGAYLVREGVDVLFVDVAPDHVAAINGTGLSVEGPIEAFTVKARAVTPDAVAGTFDRVWLCTKAQHTDAAARAIAPHLAPDGHVLSLQNGLTERIVAEVVGRERTLGAFINFGADYLTPGRIMFGGRGAVVVGELDGSDTPRLEATHRLLSQFDPAAIMTADIWGYLWGKLGYGALLFATALTDDAIADVLARQDARPALTALARELCEAAAAEGVTPQGFNGYEPDAFARGDPAAIAASFEAMVAHNRKSAKSHSGIWRDLAVRKRSTEVEPILTQPLSIARARGLAMPRLERLIALVKDLEAGRRERGEGTLAALIEAHEVAA